MTLSPDIYRKHLKCPLTFCGVAIAMSALPPKADIHSPTGPPLARNSYRTFSTSGSLRDLSKSAFSGIDEIFEYLKSIKLAVAQTAAPIRPDEATKLSTHT